MIRQNFYILVTCASLLEMINRLLKQPHKLTVILIIMTILLLHITFWTTIGPAFLRMTTKFPIMRDLKIDLNLSVRST